VTHTNIQPTIDLTMGVYGRDLGHVADDVAAVISEFGTQYDPKGRKPPEGLLGVLEGPHGLGWFNQHGHEKLPTGTWIPYDPDNLTARVPMKGTKIVLSGEYARMIETFQSLGLGLVLATLLIYFLMTALFKSYLTPLVILFAVPIGLVGVIAMLYLTGTAINVQSLLGVIFMVGIVVSNTVLLVDFAQNLRFEEGLTPDEAIRKAASIRVRPVVMTALAAFFALVPMSLALSRGSEANGPLGRAVIGGLLAGMVTTLFVVPSLYSLVVRDPGRTRAVIEPTIETESEPEPDVGWV
jgi:hypothetical protein